MQTDKLISEVLADPSTSLWLRDALNSALQRDVCDAANDAETLATLLVARSTELLSAEPQSSRCKT
jgi:hypothetical protein